MVLTNSAPARRPVMATIARRQRGDGQAERRRRPRPTVQGEDVVEEQLSGHGSASLMAVAMSSAPNEVTTIRR
jgi:hypothetical protein